MCCHHCSRCHIYSIYNKTTFLDKYFPSTLRIAKEFEFQQLRQGNMLVVEYAEKFEDMTAYSGKSMYSPYEKWKVDQFLFGLRGEISHSVSQIESFLLMQNC